jgi:diguanylate cyclase (GGDEF)-like protein
MVGEYPLMLSNKGDDTASRLSPHRSKGRVNSVKRALPFLLARNLLAESPSPSSRVLRKTGYRTPTSNQASSQRILARIRPKSEESLEEMLTSTLLVQDKELAGIIHEVDELLRTIKADTPQTQAVSSALQRTVLCAVKQSLLDRELQSLALTDDLTCLYNRRAFLALATQQVRLMRRKGEGLLLFFADVDRLKDINDCFGHREGDLALVRTANALEETFRDSDILARLGGDEFAVLAVEASCQNQEVILRRLERSLRKSNADESRYQLSLSVGVARLDPKHFVSVGELLEQADQAMYEEKRKKDAREILNDPALTDPCE